jgi:hypothetical protein
MRTVMKSLMAGALVSLATVAGSGGANSAPCPATMLAPTYTNLDGTSNGFACQIDDKTFNNFTYTNAGLIVPVPAAGVGVLPLDAVNPGFQFNGNWVVAAGVADDVTINFHVAENPGSPAQITDAMLTLMGLIVPAGGSVVDAETLTLSNGNIVHLTATNTNPGPIVMNFGGVPSLDVTNDMGIIGGTTMPTQVSIIDKQFSQTGVPEPASLAILGVSLLGMGVAYRRRFRK